MVLSYLNNRYTCFIFHRVASQYDLPNYTNWQFLQPWKPQLISFQRYNSAHRHYFRKPPDRIVHLSNLYSDTEMELAYNGVLCSAFTQLATSPLWPFTGPIMHAIVMCTRSFDHVPYAAFASNQLTTTTWVPTLASQLTILGTLHKPSQCQPNHYGQTKVVS